MPFIAIDTNTKKRIDITTIEKPRTTLRDGQFVCQLCGNTMFVRGGGAYATHFCHKTACQSNIFGKRERDTPEHRFGKIEIARMLEELFNDKQFKIEYEIPLMEISQVPDILVTYPMGWRMAHEIQLSNISEKDIEDRTNGYESIGIDVIWWLGEKVSIPIRNWCIERFGRVFIVKISQDSKEQPISLSDFL
jgi:competence protein CoiA